MPGSAAALRRLQVIGRDAKQRLSARLFGRLRELDSRPAVVAAGARNDRHPPGCGRDGRRYDAFLFTGRQERRLARRAAGHERHRATIDLAMAERLERQEIDAPIAERRRQGDARTVKFQLFLDHDMPPYAASARRGEVANTTRFAL